MIVLLYGRLDSINAIIFVTICSKNLGVPGELCFILVRVRVIYPLSYTIYLEIVFSAAECPQKHGGFRNQ